MGCDIHIFLEKKDDKNHWVDSMIYENSKYGEGFKPLSYYGRDYTLFAVLAGVRGDNPIEYPKGIPENCSPEYRKLCEDWGDDGHSHSYFTLRELIDAAPNYSEFRKQSLDGFILHLNNIIKMVDIWTNKEEVEKYRVCFFFDN